MNPVSGPTEPGISASKHGAWGVIPAKFTFTCDGDLVDTLEEADAVRPVTLRLTVVIDDTELFNDRLQEWEDFFHRPHGGLGGPNPV